MGSWAEALSDAESCIQLKSDWSKGYSRKGLALLGLNRVPDAVECYAAGLKLDPNNEALKTGFERATAQLKLFESQLTAHVAMKIAKEPKLAKYLNEDPDYLARLVGVVRSIGIGPIGDAHKLKVAVSLAPREIKEGLAAIFGFTLPEEATRTTAAKQATPETMDEVSPGEDWRNKGNAAYHKREFEEAIRCYDEAIKAEPNEILYHNNKAAVYMEMGNFERCLEICQEAIEKRYEMGADFSKVAKVYNRMAACYRKMQDYKNAIEMYKKSLCETTDRKVRVLLRETEALLEKKKIAEKHDPEKAEQLRLEGNILFKEKRYPEAKIKYDEAIIHDLNDDKLYANRSAVYTQLLEYPSAMRDIEKSLALNPNNAKAWARKGLIHLRLKDFNKALNAYQEGLKVDANNEECLKGLNQTMLEVKNNQLKGEVDEDQIKRGMEDKEVQQIIGDPQFQMVLQQLQSNPSRLGDYLKDPKIASGLQKLIVAGVLRME